ncbi:MAG TPA: recombinase family protein, partial [Symbiobacteriaceae bacterium]|nr:recombinase family protein [Symbiobacteriaceae bacterium]
EQFDTTTATGRLMIRMVAEFAQWERETIAERTAFGKQKKAAAGEWGGGRPPFGYALAPSDRVKGGRTLLKLVPDPARAHLVGAIFERYLAGHGVRAIATWLNTEMGARSALGRPWDGVKVARMLQNPVYLGVIATGRAGGGQRRLVPGTHPPLVAATIFHQVQAMFTARRQMAPRQATGTYPLSGIAVCGACGGPIRVQHASRSSRYYYGCRSHATGRGCGVPPLTSAPGSTTEARVAEAIASAVASPVHLDRFWMQLVHEAVPVADDTSRLLTDLAEAERAIARWDRLYETDILTEEEYITRAAPHRARIRLLRERLRQARQAPAPPPQREGPATHVMAFPAAWAAAEPAERKMLLQHFTAAWGVVIRLLPGQGLDVSQRPH